PDAHQITQTPAPQTKPRCACPDRREEPARDPGARGGGGGGDELLQPAAARRRPAAARVRGQGRLPAAGVPSGRLPAPGAGLPASRLPPAGLPAAVRAAAAAPPAAAAEQRAFLHGGMPGRPLLLLSPGRLLLRREGGRKTTINFVQLGLSYPSLTEKCC
uniref:Uncharacterized protein n=1 Tax=Triticum urartu TaxID=4572 RepID=A0A8R7TFG3_TRIUA